MFGETNVDAILAECEACHKAHPNNHVRLLGFDNYAQSAGGVDGYLPRQARLILRRRDSTLLAPAPLSRGRGF